MVVSAREMYLDHVPPPMGEAMRNWMHYHRATSAHIRATYYGCEQILVDEKKRAEEDRPVRPVLEQLTNREIAEGYPILHGHSLMGTWGAFECFVEDVVIGYLLSDASLAKTEPFKNVKVPAAALLEPEEGRAWILLEAARKPGGPGSGRGYKKFETLLDLVGGGGPVTSMLSDVIFEAQQIRNVWAHKGGIADRHFVRDCPGLGISVGERVKISKNQYARYADALHMYSTVIVCRHEQTARSARFDDVAGFEGTLSELGLAMPEEDSEPGMSAPE